MKVHLGFLFDSVRRKNKIKFTWIENDDLTHRVHWANIINYDLTYLAPPFDHSSEPIGGKPFLWRKQDEFTGRPI